jgi:hypothetical protein
MMKRGRGRPKGTTGIKRARKPKWGDSFHVAVFIAEKFIRQWCRENGKRKAPPAVRKQLIAATVSEIERISEGKHSANAVAIEAQLKLRKSRRLPLADVRNLF